VLGWVSRMWGQDESSLSTATTMDRYLRSFYWAIMSESCPVACLNVFVLWRTCV
jgi:hypothetical protein